MRLTQFIVLAAFATSASAATPAPGTCQYRTAPGGGRTSVKLCSITGNYGEFQIRVAKGVPVLVKIAPDQLSSSVRPDPKILSFGEQNGLLVYEPLVGSFAGPVVAQISTQGGLDITLRFVISENPDTQVHILRPDQADRDAACDRRVGAVKAELQADYEKKEATLATRAQSEGRLWVLGKMLNRFAANSIKGVNLEDFLRIRAREQIRLGDVVILKVEIDERKGEALTLEKPRAFLMSGSTKQPLTSDATCDKLRLGPGESTFCAIAAELPAKISQDDRLLIQVTDNRDVRSVTLGGIDVR